MADLGKAYVQIVPSAEGISGKLKSLLDPEATLAGASSGKGFASQMMTVAKQAIVAAGIGKAISASIKEGAQLEQSIGGIETLFKGSADRVKGYAQQAYKTAGVSSNEYMQNVTKFSASLLQSLGGNTSKAAKIANMAMIDMSDNANKMGTNMQDIQNAYQGFAKQNYTMLDNLRLGYGGTKTEMQRLLADAEKLTGVKYDISNLSDVYQAIHAIQTELGITGTTALEAATTLSGSFGMVKAALKDTLGSLALGDNLKQSIKNLTESLGIFLFDNLIPMVGNVVSQLPEAIGTFIMEAAPILAEKGGQLIQNLIAGISQGVPNVLNSLQGITEGLGAWVQTSLPQLLQSGVTLILELANGLMQGLPQVLVAVGQIMNNLVSALISALPSIIMAAGQLALGLAEAFITNLPQIIAALGMVLLQLIGVIQSHKEQFYQKGQELIGKLKDAIVEKKNEIVTAIKELITNMVQSIAEKVNDFKQKGAEIITNFKAGIVEKKTEVVTAVKELITSLATSISEKYAEFKTKGSELMSNVRQGISDKQEELKSLVSQILTAIVAKFSEKLGEFRQKGTELMNGVRDGFNAGKSAVTDAARNVVNSAKNAVMSLKGGFVSVGSNIIRGMAQGIRNGAGAVASAARQAANNALRAAKSALGIRSPSRVFRDEVGKWIPEGMAVGIQNNIDTVSDAVKEMRSIVTDAPIPNIGVNTSSSEDGHTLGDAGDLFQKGNITINLVIGGQNFRAFVDRISLEQDREINLELAY